MTWAQRLKRVFNIDSENCSECGSHLNVIASMEDPEVIKQILDLRDRKVQAESPLLLPEGRAPPSIGLCD